MKIKATLIGTGHYSQSKPVFTPKKDGENAEDYEQRTCRERAHTNNKGEMVVPAISLKNMLASTAKRLSMPVPGNKRKTFSKAFLSAVIPQTSDPILKSNGKTIKACDVHMEPVFCSVDGQKESTGKRVTRFYPMVDNWEVDCEFEVIDPSITEEIFLKHLTAAGQINGLGRFRPQNGGLHGRFDVEYKGKIQEAEMVVAEDEV